MPLHLQQKMNQQKGNGVRSLLLCLHFRKLNHMDNAGIIATVTQWINDLLAERPGFFLVQVRIAGSGLADFFGMAAILGQERGSRPLRRRPLSLPGIIS